MNMEKQNNVTTQIVPWIVNKKPSILFVSNTSRTERPYIDPSSRYRAHNLGAEFARQGHKTTVVSQTIFERNIDVYQSYDFMVFHRPQLTELIVDFFIDNSFSDRIIADFDDSILRVDQAELTPACRFRGIPLGQVAKNIASMSEACEFFKRFSVSTSPLAEEITELFNPEQAEIIPNALDPAFIGVAAMARRAMQGKKRPYRYGYFPGTATHDADFQMIVSALTRALTEDKNAYLLIVGPITIPEEMREFEQRIHKIDIVPFHRLPFLMALVEHVLAPLEINPFTIAKSGLKFFEAAVAGCITSATPIPDIDRFTSPLLNKCSTQLEWEEALLSRVSINNWENEIVAIENQVNISNISLLWLQKFA